MPRIAIVTDTDSSLPAEVAARYNILQVPVSIHFDDKVFETGVDIDDAQLFARIDHLGKLPTTAAPSPGKFAEAYRAAMNAGAEKIICFCVSSAVSATFSAAVAGRELVPDAEITVVDTYSLAMGQGFMVLAAAEAAQAGAPSDEIIACAIDVRERTHLFAALPTLKYLAMSGRVGYLAAGMANLLNIKPILTIRDGKLELLERVRTQKKAWERVVELARQACGGNAIERMAIVQVNAPQAAVKFRAQLCARLPCPDAIIRAELTPGLSVHSGAGLVGVALVTGK